MRLLAAESINEILDIRQEYYDQERNMKKNILRETYNLDGKFSYETLLNLSSYERRLLGEICQDIDAERKGQEVYRN